MEPATCRPAIDEAIKNKGASAVKLLRTLKLSRKVFRLPGSIWREDNLAVHRRQSNSRSIPVQICGQDVQNYAPSAGVDSYLCLGFRELPASLSCGGGARTWAAMLKKIQKFGHSFAGFCGQFENFHAWADGLDVALCGGFFKFHGGGGIGVCFFG